MYQEYIQKWTKFSNQYGERTCLFYLVGKFYELYDILDKKTGEGFTNVKQAVETLGITLTTKEKDGPHGEDCYFAGFPEQSLQKFAALLTREGWTVVVCDQEKNSSGRVTDRPIARIFSPGTHIELAGAEAPYLAGVWMEEREELPPAYAATVLDMTTGHLVSFEHTCQGNAELWSSDELVHFFQIHTPRELVIWWCGANLTRPTEGIFRRRFGIGKASLHIESGSVETQGNLENPIIRKSYLEQIFSKRLCLLPILEQLQIRNKPLSERVLVNLLRFAEEHLPSAIQNLSEHIPWTPENSVYMGNNTLSQLNYISTGAENSVLSLFNKTLTSLGKREMRERLLSPSSNIQKIQKQLKEVEFCKEVKEQTIKHVEGYLRMIHDIARLHRRILMYNVTASDILALDQSYGCANAIQTHLEDTILGMTEEKNQEFCKYRKQFQSSFDIEKAKIATKDSDISFLPKEKAPTTCEIESKIAGIKEQVNTLLETLRTWVGLPPEAIRIESQDTASFMFTATKTTLRLVKDKLQRVDPGQYPFPGIVIHEKKSSRGTIEFPKLESFHYQLFHLRSDLERAIKEELPPICRDIQSSMWTYLEKWIAHVDVSMTLAKVAKERGYTKPKIVESEEAGLQAIGLRHPLLESIQTRVEYVKHDVDLGFQKEIGWLLYGMNASGKSSLMKSIGVSVLLAQAGSYVPATTFKLKPFKSILTRILNQDNLWAGLSSFAVEISELRDIFQKADERSLVLGDELCSGTESISATSLVAAGIKHLHDKRSRFVFATHLHDLNKIAEISSLPSLGIWHLRVHYDAVKDTLIYDRTLHRGPGGTLYGLEVARAMHLPHELLKQAIAYRRMLLGETSIEESSISSWNSEIIRKECEICKHSITRDLEVHHIKPRAEAKKGRFEDGTSMNDIRNLIVVCQSCHDKHHAGEIEIGSEVQTSQGPQRSVLHCSTGERKTKVKVKWTKEELEKIEVYIRRYPHLKMELIKYYLKQEENIDISNSSLKTIRDSIL